MMRIQFFTLNSFYLWILNLVRPSIESRLLDIGCGQGRIVSLAREFGVNAVGFDISGKAMQDTVKHTPHLCLCDGENICFPDETFDFVTNIGSLEHFPNLERGVAEMAQILKPEGSACILLPNLFGLFSTVLFAYHQGRLADDNQPIQRFAARYEWQDILEKNGLKVHKTYKYEAEFPRNLSDWSLYLNEPKRLIRMLLSPLLPINIANSVVFICQKS